MSLDADIACLLRQEERIRFASFDEADAWRLGCSMRQFALESGLPLVMEVRIGERPLFYSALRGCSAKCAP